MNKEFMLRAAEYLEKLPEEKFNMDSFFCGTTACVAGHMCLMAGYQRATESLVLKDGGKLEHPESVAMKLADLTLPQSGRLFYNFDLQTPSEAAAQIREMVEKYA